MTSVGGKKKKRKWKKRGKKKRIFDQNKYCQKLEHGFISTSLLKSKHFWSGNCFAVSPVFFLLLLTAGLFPAGRRGHPHTRLPALKWQQAALGRDTAAVSFPPCTRRCQRQHLNPPSLEGSGQFITALSLCQGEPLGHVCSIYTPVREEEWQSPPVGQHPGLPAFPNWLSFHWKASVWGPLLSSLKHFHSWLRHPSCLCWGTQLGQGTGSNPAP